MEISENLKITVGIITYDRPEFLKEAVNSVLQQSFRNFELIISNDNVDVDISFETLGIKNDARIKIVNQATNLGVLNNMNYLLGIAKGEWFVWLSEDDLLHPEFLKLAYNVILKNQKKNIVGFFSNYMSVPSPCGVFPAPLKSNACLVDSASSSVANFLIDYSSRKYPLVGECGLMHVGTLKKIGGIPKLGSGPGHYSDTLLPILLIEHGSICWLDDYLVFFRASPDSISHNSTDFFAYTSAEADFLKNIRRVCASQTVNMRPDKVIANMVKWFALLEWQVLSRSPSLSKYSALVKFIKYQLNENLPKLAFKYKINHITFLITRLTVIIYKKLHLALKTKLTIKPKSVTR